MEVRLAGTGGQGIVTAAIILGQAIAIYDELYATQTQSYGPESRGSTARAGVVISDEPIDFPKVTSPDILVVISQAACDKYLGQTKPSATIIIDPDMVATDFSLPPKTILYKIPATKAGETISQKPLVTNIVMLGALAAIPKVTTIEPLAKSLEKYSPRQFEPNLHALQLGYQLGEQAISSPDKTAVFDPPP